MRQRYGVLVVVVLLVLAAACSGKSSKGASDNGLGGSNTTVPATQTACANPSAAKTASDVGITPTDITVTVLADVDNAARPGLFRGSWNGVQAWADYMNAQGGVGCRHVIVKKADAHLNGDQAKAAVAQACTDSFAMVGTTALFLSDVTPMNTCKDKTGAATGLPDLAELQTEAVQQCSPVSFAALPTSSACPYSGHGPREYKVGYTQYDYYFNNVSKDLHGVFAIPKDVPSTIASSMPIFRAENQMGIKSDFEKGMSGLDTQPAYTPVVQQIKQHNSNYARNGLDYTGTLLERKEAAAQGVNDQVKVWDCSLQCYDKRLISAGGSAVERQYVWLNFLPMEDPKGTNKELDAFLQYDKQPDGFGLQAFIAGLAFTRAVNDTIAAHGNDPNSLTRANLLTAIRNMHDFDANGLTPKIDVGNKTGSTCLVGMQVQNGKFVRIDPQQPGTFDCDNNKPPLSLTIDPQAEYHG